MLKERKLKVYSQTRTSNSTGYFSQTKCSEVPAILLSGKWLEAAGFSISDHTDQGHHCRLHHNYQEFLPGFLENTFPKRRSVLILYHLSSVSSPQNNSINISK